MYRGRHTKSYLPIRGNAVPWNVLMQMPVKTELQKERLIQTTIFKFNRSRVSKIEALIKCHPWMLTYRTESGLTLLHEAIVDGRLDIVKLLVSQNAYIDARDKRKETPLFYAVDKADIKCTSFLLEMGSKVGLSNIDRLFPLHSASEYHRYILVKKLLDNKAKINCRDVRGDTPLHLALKQPIQWNVSGTRTIKTLLQCGANVNAQNIKGHTPLHYCTYWYCGNEKALQTLIDSGADPDIVDNYHVAPLAIAFKKKQSACIKILEPCTKNKLNALMRANTLSDDYDNLF